jgi:predicted TIM-barrel fold metal-dependent hydrolase
MIDAHIHLVPPNLPGVGSLNPVLEWPLEARATTLRQEMQAAGVTAVLAMGSYSRKEEDPLGIAATLRLGQLTPGIHAVGIADPTRTDAEHFQRIDAVLATGQIKALKIYLGYLHYGPEHPHYVPYYELAARHGLPVIFHTGDTYSARAKLRYALPLLVDDVAVDHPNVRFVLAHLGNPWLTDAAEVVYKNVNVWADLSGFVVGDAAAFRGEERQELLQEAATALGRAFRYAERPTRFLYGSDWPLVPMTAYRDFIATAIPELYHPLVFDANARQLFRLSS